MEARAGKPAKALKQRKIKGFSGAEIGVLYREIVSVRHESAMVFNHWFSSAVSECDGGG